MAKKSPRGTRIQSLVFDRSQFTRSSARSWAVSHGFKAPKTDEKQKTIRIRQEPPGRFAKGSYRTISLDAGVQGVIASPKSSVAPKESTSKKSTSKKKASTKKPGVSRKRSSRYKLVSKTVIRGGKRVKTHMWVLKASAKKKKR